MGRTSEKILFQWLFENNSLYNCLLMADQQLLISIINFSESYISTNLRPFFVNAKRIFKKPDSMRTRGQPRKEKKRKLLKSWKNKKTECWLGFSDVRMEQLLNNKSIPKIMFDCRVSASGTTLTAKEGCTWFTVTRHSCEGYKRDQRHAVT